MLRDWSARICLGSRAEGENLEVVGGGGEGVGESAVSLVAFVVMKRSKRGRRRRKSGGGFMVEKIRVRVGNEVRNTEEEWWGGGLYQNKRKGGISKLIYSSFIR